MYAIRSYYDIFAIRDTAGLYKNQLVTYSPEWFDVVKYTVKETKRLGISLGFNTCDGFTTAGGPWITPELSMQKVVCRITSYNVCYTKLLRYFCMRI